MVGWREETDMPRRFKDPATYTYVRAHQDLVTRLVREAVLIGETHDGQMRLYAERLRPEAGATWCKLHAIPAKPPTNSGEASVFHLSHNGKRWRQNFDKFSMTEHYPVEMQEWDQKLCAMVFTPGEIPRPR